MKTPEDYMLPCLNKKIFGIDCPGCGMQRSIAHIAKGEFAEAFHMYPAIYTLILLAVFFVLNKKYSFKYGSKIILTLAIINGFIIVTSYLKKMNLLINF